MEGITYQEEQTTNRDILIAIIGLDAKVNDMDIKFETKFDSLTTTIQDVLFAVNDMSTVMDQRFENVENRLDRVDGHLTKVEATMVTKDYLDEKIGNERGDRISMMRRQNDKVIALVDHLDDEAIIDPFVGQNIRKMEPFSEK